MKTRKRSKKGRAARKEVLTPKKVLRSVGKCYNVVGDSLGSES